ncbi:hypothetical protein CEXT_74331 [Caerostris extrusa]|uniref:Uncharacterized protein n=1 Tax=Caerostris extrusa TaxID=172846 RepID=A0AAV4TYU4_CAEEX|nr:hypothetical protein CEXT_74331 [Caerostris extrusa]
MSFVGASNLHQVWFQREKKPNSFLVRDSVGDSNLRTLSPTGGNGSERPSVEFEDVEGRWCLNVIPDSIYGGRMRNPLLRNPNIVHLSARPLQLLRTSPEHFGGTGARGGGTISNRPPPPPPFLYELMTSQAAELEEVPSVQ